MELLWTTGGLRPAVRSMERWKVRDLAAVIKQLAIMEEKRMQQKWGLQRQGQERDGRRMKNNNASFIDITLPWDSREEQKKQEKKEINTKK